MSKVTKRKITVESPSSKLSNSSILSNSNTNKDSQRRQSVFERLGTKTGASISINTATTGQQPPTAENFCRHWNQNGTCPYGKSCVFVNTHTLISPSKRVPKKDLDPKQALLARSLEEGLKRLHSTVVRRSSPEPSWESWDQTDLEYEDERVLEKRRQLLQRELELQMKREETEEQHHSRRRHLPTNQKKGLSSSSSTSVSSTTSESSSSSDDSSSDSSSTSGVAGDSKRKKSKAKKSKRGSTSSVSDIERKKIRASSKSMHKDRSPSSISRKSTSSRDKRGLTPPRKSATSGKMTARKKSPSPAHRRHNTPTTSSKNKPSTSKSSSGSRHIQSPRPPSKRSTSIERKEKHKRSLSPRSRSKPSNKERSPRRQDRPRRKDSPDTKPRNTSRTRLPDSRSEDRKKDDDRSRNKDDRRQDRKTGSDRDKRDHEDARAREKAREAAREKEREEALERCRERQREREQLAKEKERTRERPREDRDKDTTKQRDYEKPIPPLMTITAHNQPDRKASDRDRDRPNKDRKDRDKDRDKDKERDRDRLYDRNVDKTDRNRPLDKERASEKVSERDRVGEKDRPRERDNLTDRPREKGDRDRSFERDRNFERTSGDPTDRTFDRDKDRTTKGLERNRDRDFDRDKDRNYERVTENRRNFEKAGERDRTSLEKDRGIVRENRLDRVMELRERNKSLDRGRASDGERSVDRGRDRFEREARFERRAIPTDDKGYESPYDSRRDRTRYVADGSERSGMFKDHSPSREDGRSIRLSQAFSEDRRSRGGRNVRGGWEAQGGYEESAKSQDWDYPDSRREWDSRNRHGDWEGAVEGEEWGRYGGGAEWGGGDWRDDWQHRPSRHPPRDDQTIVSSNHIVVRDVNVDEAGGRRSQAKDSVEKDPASSGDFKKDIMDTSSGLESGSHKRTREEADGGGEAKKPRLEEPPPSIMLEEALSDISDDPDEILNREDIDVTPQDSAVVEEDVRSSGQPSAQELDQRLLEDRPIEGENIDNDNLDFEEISDEELEEEARANRGLGDALGVDWASLVTESRPRPVETQPGAARRRWQPANILARIGVSLQYAGEQVFQQIQQTIIENNGAEEEKEKTGLLHPVAALHVALRDKQARRKCLFSGTDSFKRALSARADIAVRRQLCNLPVASLEVQQSSGFCQWVV